MQVRDPHELLGLCNDLCFAADLNGSFLHYQKQKRSILHQPCGRPEVGDYTQALMNLGSLLETNYVVSSPENANETTIGAMISRGAIRAGNGDVFSFYGKEVPEKLARFVAFALAMEGKTHLCGFGEQFPNVGSLDREAGRLKSRLRLVSDHATGRKQFYAGEYGENGILDFYRELVFLKDQSFRADERYQYWILAVEDPKDWIEIFASRTRLTCQKFQPKKPHHPAGVVWWSSKDRKDHLGIKVIPWGSREWLPENLPATKK